VRVVFVVVWVVLIAVVFIICNYNNSRFLAYFIASSSFFAHPHIHSLARWPHTLTPLTAPTRHTTTTPPFVAGNTQEEGQACTHVRNHGRHQQGPPEEGQHLAFFVQRPEHVRACVCARAEGGRAGGRRPSVIAARVVSISQCWGCRRRLCCCCWVKGCSRRRRCCCCGCCCGCCCCCCCCCCCGGGFVVVAVGVFVIVAVVVAGVCVCMRTCTCARVCVCTFSLTRVVTQQSVSARP
jgi:hypothetical protein